MERTQPVVAQQHFNKSIEEVWNAITHVGHMTQWFFENIPAFEAKVGFETSFNVHANGRDYLHLWKITEVIPLEKIVY
ncbi:MAG: SRPBCC domain-containing protein, partial [Chloroflexia bacterium]|nr:SRPBCC domain-containing protein [Chloroflexia bacterium]